jgi:hypothetical protein
MKLKTKFALLLLAAIAVLTFSCNQPAKLSPEEVTKLTAAAYVQSYPIIENYKGIYFYGVLKSSPKYVPMNSLLHEAKLYSPSDKFVVSPNNDTYYSTGIFDLRAEPVIIKVPEAKERYYTFQLVSMTTDNFGYIGTNSTGTKAGTYAITSPNFSGQLPAGVTEIKSPSEFIVVAGRTAVNAENPEDSKLAIAQQKKYEVGPIHNFYPDFAIKKVAVIDYPPYQATDFQNEAFFSKLNFLLQFIKLSDEEQKIMNGFEKIGVKAGIPYDFYTKNPEFKEAISKGIELGEKRVDSLATNLGKNVNGWELSSTDDYFGTNYALRTGWGKRAIYVNSPKEAYYPSIAVDSNGNKLNGNNQYSITFSADNLPPAKFFWSLTMYYAESKLLVENEIKRYSIGDRTKSMKYNKDGSLSVYFGNKKPKEGTANWLPAPAGNFYMLMRLYGPSEKVLKGEWTPPAISKQLSSNSTNE